MSKIFFFNSLTPLRKADIIHTGEGSYTYDLRDMSDARLTRLSKGWDIDARELLLGRVLVFETFYDDSGSLRAIPLREQFTASEWALLKDGSANKTVLHAVVRVLAGNTALHMVALCNECGRFLTSTIDANAHRCTDAPCPDCGANMSSALERRVNLCAYCIKARAERIADYHGRIFRSMPIFEKDDKRETLLHLGVECEIDGGARCDEFDDDDAQRLADCFSWRHGAPFVEFEHDSSINGGAECIFQPTTYKGLAKRKSEFADFYATAKTLNGQFKRANGLHFHVDRDFFGQDDETRGRCAVLIDLMIYKFYEFFLQISRREEGATGYCEKKNVTGLYSAFNEARHQAHCDAVNGGGVNTIEFRFFGGHIDNANDFLACADIVQAVARWAKKTTLAQAERCTPCDIVKFLKDAENVRAFVDGRIDERPRTSASDAQVRDFLDALNAQIERDNARKGGE